MFMFIIVSNKNYINERNPLNPAQGIEYENVFHVGVSFR